MPADSPHDSPESAGAHAVMPVWPRTIWVPAPTVAPLMLAAGVALVALGVIINVAYCTLGLLLTIAAVVAWIWQLLHFDQGHEEMAVAPPEEQPRPVLELSRPELIFQGRRRTLVPEVTYPYRAGFWGGLLGGTLMAVMAVLYGQIAWHSIWVPVNLLAGAVFPGFEHMTPEQLRQFYGTALVAAFVIHLVLSIGVGMIYAIILPMLPGWPIFWAAVVAPILWSGSVYGMMGVANPTLDRYVNWYVFIGSQFLFGVGTGIIVQLFGKEPVELEENRPPARSPASRQGNRTGDEERS
jgi:hypothetical protein